MIWIDVSDLMVWKGHMTGIQRVVFNIASRMQRYQEVRFFYYDPGVRVFHEATLDFSIWLNQRSAVAEVGSRSKKELLLQLVPVRVRQYAPAPLKRFVKKSAKYVLSKSVALKKSSVKRQAKQQPLSFNETDVLLVLGNAWNDDNLFLDLGKKKLVEKFKLVNVVYDLIPVLEPQFFGNLLTKQYANYMFEAIASCDLLLPISKCTDKDLDIFANEVGLRLPETQVIRLGDEISSVGTKDISGGSRTPYILCVGTIEVRKNHALLYYAYRELLRTSKPESIPQLIIVGSKGWYTDDILMLFHQDPQVSKKVTIRYSTTDQELAELYENALFTIYPSMYEGWGLPLAESLAYGKVTLSSNLSSMPEVGGDCVDYFSPYDALGCAQLISRYLDRKIRQEREAEIKKRHKITLWDDTLQQVKKAVETL